MKELFRIENVAESYQLDLKKAIHILSQEGCKEIYLFGSLGEGNTSEQSDIDLAVKGLKKGDFFIVYGKLIMSLEHQVDLVNLGKNDRFSKMLREKGKLIRVA
jgi:predicted nucleotidyltransferase